MDGRCEYGSRSSKQLRCVIDAERKPASMRHEQNIM